VGNKQPSTANSPTLPRYMLQGAIVVAAAAILTLVFHDSWLMKRMQLANLDSWLLSREPKSSDSIALIQITEDDYHTLFGAESPLQPEIVQKIVTAIASSGAEVIGVDIDTSEWNPHQAEAWLSASNLKVPIVWAREATGPENDKTLAKVLGQWQVSECWAVPTGFEDEGVVREVSAAIRLSEGETEPTLAAVLASIEQSRDSHLDPGCNVDPRIWRMTQQETDRIQINFGQHRFQSLSSNSLLKLSQIDSWRNGANALKGRLVLVGGSFRAARDKYNTPIGHMDGIEILAHSIDTLLPGGSLPRISNLGSFWIEFAVGVFFLLPAYYLPRIWALAILVCTLPVMSFLASFVVFQMFGYFVSFVPVLAGVFIHEMIEHYEVYFRLRRENQELLQLVREDATPTAIAAKARAGMS
jgi:CHASE2 domain-containing sensor protein